MFYTIKSIVVMEGLLCIGMMAFHFALRRDNKRALSTKMIAIIASIPAVGMLIGNIYAFDIFLIAVAAFNSRSRTELAGVYVAILPTMPVLTQNAAVYGLYIAQTSTVMALSVGALIAILATKGKTSRAMRRNDIAALLLVTTFIYIYSREGGILPLLRSIVIYGCMYGGPYLLLSRSIRDETDLRLVLTRLALGASLTATVAIFQATRHWIIYQDLYSALHVEIPLQSWTLAMRGGLVRTGGTLLDYSAGGLYLSGVVCLICLTRRYYRPVGFYGLLMVLLAGLMCTQSRGAWLAAFVGGLVILVSQRRFGLAAILAAAAAAAEGAILTVAKSGTLGHILGNTSEATGTIDYRKDLLSQGLRQVWAHPIFGQQQQQLIDHLSDLVQGQKIVDFVNGHLFIAMTAGLPFFLCWVFVWGSPVVQTFARLRSASTLRSQTAVPLALLIPPLIALVATSIIDRNLIWPMIGLAITGPVMAIGVRPVRRNMADAVPRTMLGVGSMASGRQLADTALLEGGNR